MHIISNLLSNNVEYGNTVSQTKMNANMVSFDFWKKCVTFYTSCLENASSEPSRMCVCLCVCLTML